MEPEPNEASPPDVNKKSTGQRAAEVFAGIVFALIGLIILILLVKGLIWVIKL